MILALASMASMASMVHRPTDQPIMADLTTDLTTEKRSPSTMTIVEQKLALAQGAAYVAMGLWPVLNLRSFAKVTGPKPEGWLVKAVGLLLVSVGTSLIRGSRAKEEKATSTIGMGAALSLGGVALYYSAKRRISPVYFADAALHLSFVTAWGLTRVAKRVLASSRPPPAC
jgi:hypothetical protein